MATIASGRGERGWIARFLTRVAPAWTEQFTGDLLVHLMARRVFRGSEEHDDPHEIAHFGSGIVVLDSHYCEPGNCRLDRIELLHAQDGRAMLMPKDPDWEDVKRDNGLEPAQR